MKKSTRILVGTALIVLASAAVLAPLLIARQDFTAFPKETKDALAAVSDLLALLAVSFIFPGHRDRRLPASTEERV